MKKAREYFESDKLKTVYICKVILSNDETNENAKFCNKIIVNNGNTNTMNNHLSTQHKHIQFIKKRQLLIIQSLTRRHQLKVYYLMRSFMILNRKNIIY
jgi:hypothetical protein